MSESSGRLENFYTLLLPAREETQPRSIIPLRTRDAAPSMKGLVLAAP